MESVQCGQNWKKIAFFSLCFSLLYEEVAVLPRALRTTSRLSAHVWGFLLLGGLRNNFFWWYREDYVPLQRKLTKNNSTMKLKGFVGKGTGKLGESVWSVFRGEQVVRHTAASVHNPKTARQELSRAKFKEAVTMSRIFNDALLVGYSGVKAQTLSARNEFVKWVIPTSAGVITGTTPSELMTDVTLLQFSRGNLPTPRLGQARATEALTINIPNEGVPDIPTQYGPGSYGVVVVAFQPDISRSVVVQVKPTGTTALNVTVPADWSGMDVLVYAFGKVIPDAKNGIPSATEPWMYPSEASATMYIGSVSII